MVYRIFALLSLTAVMGASQVALADRSCSNIKQACMSAGFTGTAQAPNPGKGLWVDCVSPIMQGTTSPKAKLPLPQVDAATITACKQAKPQFGAGKIGK
jgi:hypothetical protein